MESRAKGGNRPAVVWLILVGLLVILLPTSALLLRQNNLNMAHLRDQLVQADESGDVAAVRRAAQKLQNYVAHHMNTETGKVALQTLYDQAADQAMAASRPPEINTDIYQAATEACRPQLTNYGYQAWASCVATKVGLNATTSLATAEASAPDPDLYYVEYVPARWSGDLAGWSLVLIVVVTTVLVVKLLIVAGRWLVDYCKRRRPKTIYRG